jgi:hypothetical protein
VEADADTEETSREAILTARKVYTLRLPGSRLFPQWASVSALPIQSPSARARTHTL